MTPEASAGNSLGGLGECSFLQGLMAPLVLGIILLALALIVLLLTVKRPRSTYKQRVLLPSLSSTKEYSFDQTFSSPYSTCDSQDSAYESPTSAFIPKHPAPPRPYIGVHLPLGQSTHL